MPFSVEALAGGKICAAHVRAPNLAYSLPGGARRSLAMTARLSSDVFYAFDILHLNGWDLRQCNLIERKHTGKLSRSRWKGAVPPVARA